MNNAYNETLFNFLYSDINGYSLSHKAREAHDDKEIIKELLYGEVPFAVWREIVEKTNPKKDGVFFDLGSGTGRVVMESHIVFDFKKSIGVELLKGLHDKACEVKDKFEKFVKPKILNQLKDRELQFVNANIFEVDLQEADLIFMNHPFKDRELFEKLEEKFLKELKPQTKIVTTIRSLNNRAFKDLGSKKYEFSWGESTIYFHEV